MVLQFYRLTGKLMNIFVAPRNNLLITYTYTTLAHDTLNLPPTNAFEEDFFLIAIIILTVKIRNRVPRLHCQN